MITYRKKIFKSTIHGWKTKLGKLAKLKGTDYLSYLSKTEAIQFKDNLLSKGHEGSAEKNIIGTLNGFWNWLMENDPTKVNILNGLKKRLPDADKKPLPTREVLKRATEKVRIITPLRKIKDFAFLILRYTACRRGAANGLRHCDINLEEKTITFKAWER